MLNDLFYVNFEFDMWEMHRFAITRTDLSTDDGATGLHPNEDGLIIASCMSISKLLLQWCISELLCSAKNYRGIARLLAEPWLGVHLARYHRLHARDQKLTPTAARFGEQHDTPRDSHKQVFVLVLIATDCNR